MQERIGPLKYTTVGLEFVIMVAIFACIGVWIDKQFGLVPIFTIAFSVFGFAGAVYRLVTQARKISGDFSANVKTKKKDSSQDNSPSGEGLWNKRQQK